MPTDVVMPQMGESIAEGTIVRWIKKVGDDVDRDEPLFEISTDKVDAEIPSPAAGVLTEIRVKEGETVPVNSVVAVDRRQTRRRREVRRRSAAAPRPAPATPAPAQLRQTAAAAAHRADATTSTRSSDGRRVEARTAPSDGSPPDRRRSCARSRRSTTSTSRRSHGTGIGGRVTKHDILGFIERGAALRRAAHAACGRPAHARRRVPAPTSRRASASQIGR